MHLPWRCFNHDFFFKLIFTVSIVYGDQKLHSRSHGRALTPVHFDVILHPFPTAVGTDTRRQRGAHHRHEAETSCAENHPCWLQQKRDPASDRDTCRQAEVYPTSMVCEQGDLFPANYDLVQGLQCLKACWKNARSKRNTEGYSSC